MRSPASSTVSALQAGCLWWESRVLGFLVLGSWIGACWPCGKSIDAVARLLHRLGAARQGCLRWEPSLVSGFQGFGLRVEVHAGPDRCGCLPPSTVSVLREAPSASRYWVEAAASVSGFAGDRPRSENQVKEPQ